MTDILRKWAAYRQTRHQEYEADTLGDEMAKEIERLRQGLMDIGDPESLPSYGDPGVLREFSRGKIYPK